MKAHKMLGQALIFISSIILFCLALSGCHRDISGSYLENDANGLLWLQIVRTPDNHLSGQLSLSVLNEDGAVNQGSFPVTGAINGNDVILTFNKFLGFGTITAGGTLEGSALTFSSAGVPTLILKRSNQNDYQHQLDELSKRGMQIASIKAASNAIRAANDQNEHLIKTISSLIAKMSQFIREADADLAKLQEADKQYSHITRQINIDLARERELARNPNESVARSQLSVEANQSSLETNQIHYSTESLSSTVQMDIKVLNDEATQLEKGCRLYEPPETLVAAHNAVCAQLSAASGTFRLKAATLTNSIASLEQVYDREYTVQQKLLQSAEALR